MSPSDFIKTVFTVVTQFVTCCMLAMLEALEMLVYQQYVNLVCNMKNRLTQLNQMLL